ncbi:MAG: hypothetical protein PHE52_01705 [Candidatus Pacebacteria bacterium]|nr:hypothetical protein [Candidatus Paceibacterota bacterium]
MKIRESKNLKYDKLPWFGPIEGYERLDPKDCLLENFTRVDDKIDLRFKNGSQAMIKAINIEGGKEIDIIEENLKDFVGRCYEDILSTDF